MEMNSAFLLLDEYRKYAKKAEDDKNMLRNRVRELEIEVKTNELKIGDLQNQVLIYEDLRTVPVTR